MEELLRAVSDGKEWVESFNRYGYREAFERYCALYEPAYAAAARENEPDALAASLLDALFESWKRRAFWNRSAARADGKMTVVTYLTPMLLRSKEPRCAALAAALCREWNARRPDDGYRTATFESIAGGFRHSILGIDFAGKHIDPEKDG